MGLVLSCFASAFMLTALFYSWRAAWPSDIKRRLHMEQLTRELMLLCYILWAASSWYYHVPAAVLVYAVCAVTLVLRIRKRFPFHWMLAAELITVVAGLIINRNGWAGILALAAGAYTIYSHTWENPEAPSPLRPFSPRAARIRFGRTHMDNANRASGYIWAILMENLVAVAGWMAFSWAIGDRITFGARTILLTVNVLDLAVRLYVQRNDIRGKEKRRGRLIV